MCVCGDTQPYTARNSKFPIEHYTGMNCFSCIFRSDDSQKSVGNYQVPETQNVKVFTYNELRIGTDNFSSLNKLGEGGFGIVYKARLKNGIVAVKVLSPESKQGAREFVSELNAISDVEHENLVKLLGCCVEGDNRILVYEYLENNSLAQTLLAGGRRNIQFKWQVRRKICLGIARGLAYLHEQLRIVHRDIKASNILLDKDLSPKISDFGLAKLIPQNASHVSTRVAGTVGYLAPEYAIRGHLTRKADIYSFGVLLLEIVSGKSNKDTELPSEDCFLYEKSSDASHGIILLRTWYLHEHNELSAMLDRSLQDLDIEEACRFAKVGLLCTQDSPKLRPIMSTVVKLLAGEEDVNQLRITKPGVITNFMELKVRQQEGKVTDSSEIASTISSNSVIVNSTRPTFTFTSIGDRDG